MNPEQMQQLIKKVNPFGKYSTFSEDVSSVFDPLIRLKSCKDG